MPLYAGGGWVSIYDKDSRSHCCLYYITMLCKYKINNPPIFFDRFLTASPFF
jgi:hypothetical protein